MPQMHWDPQTFTLGSFPVPVLKLQKLDVPKYKTEYFGFSRLAKVGHEER
jgi:hypothetical protein